MISSLTMNVVKSIADVSGQTGEPGFNPLYCVVPLHIDIGPDDEVGANIFSLWVVSRGVSVKTERVEWGFAALVVKEFNWDEVEREIHELVRSVEALPFNEANDVLRRYMFWEYDPICRPVGVARPQADTCSD